MGSRSQNRNNNHIYDVEMTQLQQDIVKKARKYRQTMWAAIASTRAAFTETNDCVVIERVGALPDCGKPTGDPPHMAGNQVTHQANAE